VCRERDPLEITFSRVRGYQVELPEERLTAAFTPDSEFVLTPEIVGPTITRNAGIIGEGVDLNPEHLEDVRRSTLLYHLTRYLVYEKFRDAGEEPRLYLFGQLKRIAKEWLDGYLVCKGDTYPAQLICKDLGAIACERITSAITNSLVGERPVRAVLDPYNPTGSTSHVSEPAQRYLPALRPAESGRIAVKVINPLGDEVMKVSGCNAVLSELVRRMVFDDRSGYLRCHHAH